MLHENTGRNFFRWFLTFMAFVPGILEFCVRWPLGKEDIETNDYYVARFCYWLDESLFD